MYLLASYKILNKDKGILNDVPLLPVLGDACKAVIIPHFVCTLKLQNTSVLRWDFSPS